VLGRPQPHPLRQRRRRQTGLDPRKQNQSNVGRPIRLVEPTAKVIKEVLA
jgi:hypothetical protein